MLRIASHNSWMWSARWHFKATGRLKSVLNAIKVNKNKNILSWLRKIKWELIYICALLRTQKLLFKCNLLASNTMLVGSKNDFELYYEWLNSSFWYNNIARLQYIPISRDCYSAILWNGTKAQHTYTVYLNRILRENELWQCNLLITFQEIKVYLPLYLLCTS